VESAHDRAQSLLMDDSDCNSFDIECDEEVVEEDAPGKRVRKRVVRYMPYDEGVVRGGYLTHVVCLARDKFYGRGYAADTETACRTFMARIMREHGMRELDIQRNIPTMLLAVFYVTNEEIQFRADLGALKRDGRIRMRGSC